MAIAFARIHYITRSKGHSAIAAAAYRSATKLLEQKTGITHNYENRKQDVVYTEIMLPQGAKEDFKEREYLWNEMEAAEDRFSTRPKQAQICRDCILALPNDAMLSTKDRIELARRFATEHFIKRGVAVDLAIHDNGDGNPHAHLLITTRRIDKDGISRLKARDLDPKVARGRVQLDKHWGEEWRQDQNSFFKEKGIDLIVDPNNLVSQVHLGKDTYHSRSREFTNHWQENEKRKRKGLDIVLTDPKAVLNQITLDRAIFTKADLAKLVDSTLTKQGEADPKIFQQVFTRIQASKELIELGPGADGKEYFTTRAMFDNENDIQNFADYLRKQNGHVISQRAINKVISASSLSEEQADAVKHLMSGKGIAALLGRAGTGKSYTLGVANDIWIASGYRVHGIALSGKAADGLSEVGIESRTITSFLYGLRNGYTKLGHKDIIVLDEAGMVDSVTYREILEAIAIAGAKFVYAGDPSQALPIGPGAPMRALLERTGYAELADVRRQKHAWQKQATLYLAEANVAEALDLYNEHKAIHFDGDSEKTADKLIAGWQKTVSNHGVDAAAIMAYTNVQVDMLNEKARASLLAKSQINEGVLVDTDKGEIRVAIGERLHFLRNDKTFGVKNGQFGTAERLARDRKGRVLGIEVRLDSKSDKAIMIDLEKYRSFTHGYAATVNKYQGQTVGYSFGYISGYGWNCHLANVLGTRHQEMCQFYVDDTYKDLDALKKGIGREAPKDSMYDWAWLFRERRGMPATDNVISRFKQHLANRIRDAKDGLRDSIEERLNPERYWDRKQREAELLAQDNAKRRRYQDATKVFAYTEAAKEAGKVWTEIFKEKESLEESISGEFNFVSHVLYSQAVERQIERNKAAAVLCEDIDRYSEAVAIYKLDMERLEKQTESHRGLEVVKQYVEHDKSARELDRDKVAFDIMQDGKKHALGIGFYEIDWKNIREHAEAHGRHELLKTLSPEEEKCFYIVEGYIKSYREAARLWADYFKAKREKGEIDTELAEIASVVSDERNEKAAVISRDIDNYKIGLDFYHIDKDEDVTESYAPYSKKHGKYSLEEVSAKRAVKLDKYANRVFSKERILKYTALIDQNVELTEDRSILADQILSYRKLHYRYIFEVIGDDKVKARKIFNHLQEDARLIRRKRLIERLTKKELTALQLVESYIDISKQTHNAWQEYFDGGKKKALLTKADKLSEERDKLAVQISEDVKRYQKGMELYGIKTSYLEKSLKAQACRDRVDEFLNPDLPTNEKVKLAGFIAEERKAHIGAVATKNIPWYTIYAYADIEKHRERFLELDLIERIDFKVVSEYVRLRRRLAGVFANKKKLNNKWSPKTQQKFNRLSAKRDALAHEILFKKEKYLDYMNDFRVKEDSLNKHAGKHQVKLVQAYQYAQARNKLIAKLNGLMQDVGQLHTLASKQNKEFIQWRGEWQAMTAHAKKWLWQGDRYNYALANAELSGIILKQDTNLLSQLDKIVSVKLKREIAYKQAENVEGLKLAKPVQIGKGKKRWDREYIKQCLNERAKEVALAAVSSTEELNTKASNAKSLVWGRKGGSLHVTINGPKVGWWNDFSHGGGKDLLSFIEHQHGISYKDSIDWAVRFLGLSEDAYTVEKAPQVITVEDQCKISNQTFTKDEWVRINDARKTWKESQPIDGTLAERYLREHRAITGEIPGQLRFNPKVWNFLEKKNYPALIVGATNSNGEIQAYQAVFLDSATANKIKSERKKQNRGVQRQAGVWLGEYKSGAPTAIVEGPETAASAFEAIGKKWNVVCSLGSNNFKSVNIPEDAKDIIILQDNDIKNSKTELSAKEAADYYADRGINTWLVKPETLGDDFNDLHQKEGIEAVIKALNGKKLYRKGLDAEAEIKEVTDKLVSQERQGTTTDWQREARRLAYVGQAEMALDLLEQHERVHTEKDFIQTAAKLLDEWLVEVEESPQSAVMLAFDANETEALNDGARVLLKQQNRITGIHLLRTKTGMKEFGVGEKIIFNTLNPKNNIEANTLGRIKEIKRSKVTVQLESNEEITFALSEFDDFGYGYALTSKQFRGKAFARGFMLMSKEINRELAKDALLVAKEMQLYYSKEQYHELADIKKQLTIADEPKPTKQPEAKREQSKTAEPEAKSKKRTRKYRNDFDREG